MSFIKATLINRKERTNTKLEDTNDVGKEKQFFSLNVKRKYLETPEKTQNQKNVQEFHGSN